MNRLTFVLVGAALAAGVTGWWLFEAQIAPEESRDSLVLVTGAAALVLAAAIAGARRRPSDAITAVLALVSFVTIVGYYRIFEPPWVATAGAAAMYLTLPVLLLVVPTRSKRRALEPTMVAVLVISSAATIGLLLTSGPRVSGGGGTRAVTWATVDRLGSDLLVVQRQANPLALWSDAEAARALWVAWGIWMIASVSLITWRWHRHRTASPHDAVAAVAVGGAWLLLGALLVSSWPTELDPAVTSHPVFDRWYTDLLFLTPALVIAAVGAAAFWEEIVAPRLSYSQHGRVQLDPTVSRRMLDQRLAAMLADPTARVLFPGDHDGDWVDEQGNRTGLAESASRSATVVRRSDRPVVAIEVDRALSAEPDLVDIAATTTSLALEQRARSARAERDAAEIRDSATRLLTAAEESRARLRARIAEGPDRILSEIPPLLDQDEFSLDEIHAHLKDALEGVRAIAHGELPMSLHETGLVDAVADLSASTGTSVTLSTRTPRPPSPELETLYLAIAQCSRDAPTIVACELSRIDGAWRLCINHATGVPDARLQNRLATLGAAIRTRGDIVEIVLPATG